MHIGTDDAKVRGRGGATNPPQACPPNERGVASRGGAATKAAPAVVSTDQTLNTIP